jgi:hypothetical protein
MKRKLLQLRRLIFLKNASMQDEIIVEFPEFCKEPGLRNMPGKSLFTRNRNRTNIPGGLLGGGLSDGAHDIREILEGFLLQVIQFLDVGTDDK